MPTTSEINAFLAQVRSSITAKNYEILEKIEIGCSVSATYINFITVVPYHSEVSVSSYVKFIVM